MGIAFMSLLVAAVSGAPSEPQHDPQEEYRRVTAAFQAKRYQEAVDLASHIVDAHPRSEFAIYAENTLLDSLKAAGRWHDLVAHMEAFERRFNADNHWDERKNWDGLRSEAHEMIARDEERAGLFWACARSQLAAANAAPDDARHAERLWNSAICFHRAHAIGQALHARLMLVRDHSPSPLAHEAMLLIAEDYGRLAYYQRAAEFYEAFARKDPRDDRAASALMRAARLRIDLIPSD